jgi:pimeloyl-ACP methyl ester carboxylesterase
MAFLGLWQIHRRGSWNDEVGPHADVVLPSRSWRTSRRWLQRHTADLPPAQAVEVRLVGYSWGGWTAGHLAADLLAGRVLGSTRPLAVRLGLLDPVGTLRGRLVLPDDDGRLVAWNAYQRNGCHRGCPGPSAWYRGQHVPGADNRDLSLLGRDTPAVDEVPPELAPDHLQLGYRAWGGWGERVARVLAGEAPW